MFLFLSRDAPIPILTNSGSSSWLGIVGIGIGIDRNRLESELESARIGFGKIADFAHISTNYKLVIDFFQTNS